MYRDIERVLVSRDEIARRVIEMGARIAADLEADLGSLEDTEGRIVIIPVLTGSVVFTADLIRCLPMKLSLELVAVSSYPGKSIESKGVCMRGDLPANLEGKHVLIVDDILDSGQTLDLLKRLVSEQRPASVRLCVLLRKPGKASVDPRPEYVGFDIPDEFVVGYGLDYDGYYRNLPEIATLRPEAR
ncbi:MAG: hypoxanthine phosphoribosyltransferase [Phycisphaeraceae bacterium]|nr:hypoxanthine phosphoribosyltransferase [Phycisphaeraceae bacterium]